jgi:hypothetical protein
MSYSKSFPRTLSGSTYPQWEEIFLTEEEEREAEESCREENKHLMVQCVDDAKELMQQKGLKDYQSDLIVLAKTLFDKRASHAVYWKERRAKEKFDRLSQHGNSQ